jgi:hypothetical protein
MRVYYQVASDVVALRCCVSHGTKCYQEYNSAEPLYEGAQHVTMPFILNFCRVLKTSEGKTLSLASLAGKPLVLFFYPKAATPGCTKQVRRVPRRGNV